MKQLMTIALAVVAITISGVQALAQVTAIKQVVNNSSVDVLVWSFESVSGFRIPPGGPWGLDPSMWIPWARNADEFQNHHILVSAYTFKRFFGAKRFYFQWTIWQHGDYVRISTGAYENPGQLICGYSSVGGDRYMTIDGSGRPCLHSLQATKGHKKILRAPIVRR
jgi:hypothetical protein